MSVSSIVSQSVFLHSTSSVAKSSDNTTIVSAASDNTNATATTSSVDATISTKWGFKVDENGFFGTDLNKVAGIPDNVKINQQLMTMAENYTKTVGSSDDPVKALAKVWSFFSKVAGNSLDPSGSMSIDQVKAMPKSFQSDGSLLNNPISVQKTDAEFTKVNDVYNKVGGMSQNTLDTGLREFFGEQSSVDTDPSNIKDWYKFFTGTQYDPNESKDKVSVGELFGMFCNGEMDLPSDYTKNVQAYGSLVKSGQDFKSALADKFGADYVKTISAGMNKAVNDPNMFDTLLKEINDVMKENAGSYLSSQNISSDLKSSGTSTQSASTLAYQKMNTVKAQTLGSLINTGV